MAIHRHSGFRDHHGVFFCDRYENVGYFFFRNDFQSHSWMRPRYLMKPLEIDLGMLELNYHIISLKTIVTFPQTLAR